MTDRRAELEKKRLKLQQLRELKELRQKEKESRDHLGLSVLSGGSGGGSGNRSATSSALNSLTSSATSSLISSNTAVGVETGSIRTDINEVDDILESIGISTLSSGGRTSLGNRIDNSAIPGGGGGISNNNHNSILSPDSGTTTVSSISPGGDGGTTITTTTSTIVNNHISSSGAGNKSISLNIASFPQLSIAPKEHVTYEKQTQTTNTGGGGGGGTSVSSTGDGRGGPLDYYVIHWDEEWDDEFQGESGERELMLTYDDLGGEEGEDSGSLFSVTQQQGGVASVGNQTGVGVKLVQPQHQLASSHHQHNGHQAHHHQHLPHQQQHRRPSLPHVEMVRPAQTQDDMLAAAEEEEKKNKPPKRQEYKEEERRHLMQTESFRKFLDRAVRITERALSCADSMDIFVDYTGQVESVDSEDKSGLRLSLNATFVDERWSRNRAVTSFDWCTQFPELLVASYNQNESAPNEPDGICLVWNMKFKKTTPEYVFHCQSPVMSACFAKFHPNLILGGTYSGQIVLWDNRSGKRVPVQRSPLNAAAHTHPVYCLKVVGTQNSHNLISISNDGKLCSWSLDMLSAPQETMELCQQKQSRLIAVMSMSFPTADYNNFVMGSQEGAVFSACRHGAKAGILDVYEGHQGPVTAIDFHQASSAGVVDFSHLFLTSSFDWTFKLWSMREQKPLYSFEDGNDYLYDVRWSPIHPALFSTVDGLGRLDIWNLNMDTELPIVSTQVEGMSALNRLIWSPNGQQLVVGDDGGRISVYDVGEQLAFPKNDEWSRFSHTVQEFSSNRIEI